MRLIDGSGHGVELRVAGYQFPDAEDLGLRHSWHMVEGTATCSQGSWAFRYPALTCDESPQVAGWLREAAHRGGALAGLAFTEPNLSLAVLGYPSELVALGIGLDLEFSPPWERRREAGTPFVVECRLTPQQLELGADEWEREIAPYPDRPD